MNRHDRLGSGDFKSPVSTSFTTRALPASHCIEMARAFRASLKRIKQALLKNAAAFDARVASKEKKSWRRRSESNRRTRLCRPLHDHSAIPP